MDQFWTWFLDWWPTIAASCTTVVAGVASLLVYRLKLRQAKAKNDALNEELRNAMLRLTYTMCPHCHTQVKLEQLTWYLPGGKKDQNLNGVPDDVE